MPPWGDDSVKAIALCKIPQRPLHSDFTEWKPINSSPQSPNEFWRSIRYKWNILVEIKCWLLRQQPNRRACVYWSFMGEGEFVQADACQCTSFWQSMISYTMQISAPSFGKILRKLWSHGKVKSLQFLFHLHGSGRRPLSVRSILRDRILHPLPSYRDLHCPSQQMQYSFQAAVMRSSSLVDSVFTYRLHLSAEEERQNRRWFSQPD